VRASRRVQLQESFIPDPNNANPDDFCCISCRCLPCLCRHTIPPITRHATRDAFNPVLESQILTSHLPHPSMTIPTGNSSSPQAARCVRGTVRAASQYSLHLPTASSPQSEPVMVCFPLNCLMSQASEQMINPASRFRFGNCRCTSCHAPQSPRWPR
jgi:hypothetical protein